MRRTLPLVAALMLLLAAPSMAADTPVGGHDEVIDTHAVQATDGHAADGVDAHHGEHVELPHALMVLRNKVFGFGYDADSNAGHILHMFENFIFALIAGTLLSFLAWTVYRRRSDLPGRGQAFAEMIVEQVDHLTTSIIGPEGRKYTPFVGTLFVYIWVMNYMGMVPLLKAPTATLINNFSLALVVFLYVQYTGIRRNGLGGYLYHLAGEPKDAVGWGVAPLLFILEFFGEFVKPLSLSLRLFGNILGEDTLLGVFALLGVVSISFLGLPDWAPGLPLHLPFLFLSLLLGLIQALVFSLLATVYIGLALGHHDDHDEKGHEAHAH